MKILIVAYYFYPTNTPRAFRAYELVKEFSKKGHFVDILIPENGYDYSELEHELNIEVIKAPSGFFLNKNNSTISASSYKIQKNSFLSKVKGLIKTLIKPIYFEGPITEYIFTLYQVLVKIDKKYDCLISIGLPFSTHIGVGLSRITNNIASTYIADYGDPFSYNSTRTHPFYLKWLEKKILSMFDYVTIPIEKAKQSFKPLGVIEKVHIIPQGFDFSGIKLETYIKHPIPHFAFAGNFYESIRNPKLLLDFLVNYKGDFIFDIYTNMNFRENQVCLAPYMKLLKGKIFIKPFVPRNTCILLMSKYDFLVNISNISDVQSPSKLIDYALAKRPVFNMNQITFDEKIFKEFLSSKYNNNFIKDFDLSTYEISNIADKFLQLGSNND